MKKLSEYWLRNKKVAIHFNDTVSRGYKTIFMHNSAEHEISSANKYENANKSWHFHFY